MASRDTIILSVADYRAAIVGGGQDPRAPSPAHAPGFNDVFLIIHLTSIPRKPTFTELKNRNKT